MKFFNILSNYTLFVLLLNIIITNSSLLKKTNKLTLKQDELTKIWGEMFSKPQGETCAPVTAQELAKQQVKPNEEPEGITGAMPRKKINSHDKQQGFGSSAYFFDYIDEIFQADIAKEFQRIFDEVKKLTPDAKEYVDPYPLSKIVSGLAPDSAANPANPAEAPADEQALIDKLKAITKNNNNVFNEKSYKNAVTAANIYKACKDFQWNYNPNESNWAKRIVDKYDFDGDGRLNPREFIIMTILHNKNILGTTCKNCYNDIVNKKIDPIFQFLDCDKDNKISAEDIWENFESLKRKEAGKTNIYTCLIKGKKYRTNAVNDFFIKNMNSFDGFLNKDDFRAAILLGYWDRHTDNEKIYPDDTKTFKQLRWGPGLDTDLVCDRINSANNPKPQTPAPTPDKIAPPATPTDKKSYFFRRQ